MKQLATVVKWILIVAFFPLSMLFVAYFRQRKALKEYYEQGDEQQS